MEDVAVLSDIRGNIHALSAVLKDIEHIGLRKLACIGGIAMDGPNPIECVQKIRTASIVLSDYFDLQLCKNAKEQPAGSNFNDFIFSWSSNKIKEAGVCHIINRWPCYYYCNDSIMYVSRLGLSSPIGMREKLDKEEIVFMNAFLSLDCRILVASYISTPCIETDGALPISGHSLIKRRIIRIDPSKRITIFPGMVGGITNLGFANYCILRDNSVEFRQVEYAVNEIVDEYKKIEGLPKEFNSTIEKYIKRINLRRQAGC